MDTREPSRLAAWTRIPGRAEMVAKREYCDWPPWASPMSRMGGGSADERSDDLDGSHHHQVRDGHGGEEPERGAPPGAPDGHSGAGRLRHHEIGHDAAAGE